MRRALFYLLLLAVGVFGETSTDTSVVTSQATSTPSDDSSTSPTSSDQSSTTSPASSANPASPVSPVSTTNPTNPASQATGQSVQPTTPVQSGSTGTSNPSGQSTTPKPAGQSTSAAPAGSTTPAASTLPNVNVNHTQFSVTCTADGVCNYQFDLPNNDQKFLATEQTFIDTDQQTFGGYKQQAKTLNDQYGQANQGALDKIKQLQEQLDQIQSRLNAIQASIETVSSLQRETSNNVVFANLYLQDIELNQRTSCYYKSCLAPTPAPTTKPPATPAPTTTPSPCVNFTCPNDDCNIDAFNRPYCKTCDGNLSGYKNCLTSECSSSGNNVTASSSGFPIVSPGVLSNFTVEQGINGSSNCVWTIPASNTGYDISNYSFTTLDSSTQLVVAFSGTSQQITSTTTARILNAVFAKTGTTFKVTLTTTNNVPDNRYFYWQLQEKAAVNSASVFEKMFGSFY